MDQWVVSLEALPLRMEAVNGVHGGTVFGAWWTCIAVHTVSQSLSLFTFH